MKDNKYLQKLIEELACQKAPVWQRTARELARATRKRRAVNLSKIERNVNEGETALVPGKVLSAGNLTKKITISAWQFSRQAEEKIRKAGGHTVSIHEMLKKNSEGKRIRIIG